jgi:hypothetical protein
MMTPLPPQWHSCQCCQSWLKLELKKPGPWCRPSGPAVLKRLLADQTVFIVISDLCATLMRKIRYAEYCCTAYKNICPSLNQPCSACWTKHVRHLNINYPFRIFNRRFYSYIKEFTIKDFSHSMVIQSRGFYSTSELGSMNFHQWTD